MYGDKLLHYNENPFNRKKPKVKEINFLPNTPQQCVHSSEIGNEFHFTNQSIMELLLHVEVPKKCVTEQRLFEHDN